MNLLDTSSLAHRVGLQTRASGELFAFLEPIFLDNWRLAVKAFFYSTSLICPKPNTINLFRGL